MKIYIAGPMTGIERYNFPAFDAKRDELKARGHAPTSPADLSRAVGFDENASIEVDRDFLRAAIVRDVHAILCCDAIMLLDGWEQSKGALGELAIARWFGLRVFYQDETP